MPPRLCLWHRWTALISELSQGLDELARLQVSADVITLQIQTTHFTPCPSGEPSHTQDRDRGSWATLGGPL